MSEALARLAAALADRYRIERELGAGGMATAAPHANYDVSPDGRQFVMVGYNQATRIVIIQNLPALIATLAGRPAGTR
jgi:hypothetical protein